MPSITINYDKWINPEYFISFRQFYEDEIKKHLKEINYKKTPRMETFTFINTVFCCTFSGIKKISFQKVLINYPRPQHHHV